MSRSDWGIPEWSQLLLHALRRPVNGQWGEVLVRCDATSSD